MGSYKPHTGIYMILNVKNGRYYIGSAMRFNKRWKEHLRGLENNRHHSKFMQRDWNKCGAEFFKFIKLVICEAKDLIAIEQKCIDIMKPVYNSAPVAGSQLGFKFSDESKVKMSEAAKRTKNFTGHKHTVETKAKISASRKGKGGGFRSAERRAKISAALKGRIIPQEMRDRISAKLTGHKQSQEQIDKRIRNMPSGHYERIAILKQKYTSLQISEVRKLIAEGIPYRSIQSITGVNRATVADIGSGRRYREVG